LVARQLSPVPHLEHLRRSAQPAAATTAARAKRIPTTGGLRITVAGWNRTIVRGGQATIDRCRATLWRGPIPGRHGHGTTWLAGHNYCGFYRWDRALRPNSRFSITLPSGRVMRYRVFARGYVARHSGSARGLIKGDVTLQTCRGSGTSFVYADLLH
jgi:hypothetical protein